MFRTNRLNRSVPRVEALEGRTLLATNLTAALMDAQPSATGRIALRGLHAEIHRVSPKVFEVHGAVQVVEVNPGLYQFVAEHGTTPMPRPFGTKSIVDPTKSFRDPLGNHTRNPAGLVGTTVDLGNDELILGGADGDYLATNAAARTIVKVNDGTTTTTYDFLGDQVHVTKVADPAPTFKVAQNQRSCHQVPSGG